MSNVGSAGGFRRAVAGVSLFIGPLLFAGAEILSPESGGDAASNLISYSEHRSALAVSALLGLASVMALIPAVFGILHRVRSRGARFGHIGAALIVYGLVTAHAALGGINLMFYEMTSPGLDRTAMVALADRLFHDPGLAGPLLLGHYAFAIGILLLGVGVWRAHAFPRWAGPCVVLWVVTDMALGSIPVGHVVGDVVSNAFGIAGFWTIGVAMLREPWDASDAGDVARADSLAEARRLPRPA